jgi:CrcB protein
LISPPSEKIDHARGSEDSVNEVEPMVPKCDNRAVTRTALVALGGLLGSVGRYWLSGFVQRLDGSEFPLGTLTVNVIGSFAVALIMVLSVERGAISPNARTFLTIGVCGGFTTMSTFSYETLALARDGEFGLATLNAGATVVSCFAAVWFGAMVGRLF